MNTVFACDCVGFRHKTMAMVGYTLIEAALVIIVVGILAALVMPNFDITTFRSSGYAEEALSALRYAQQTAVARNTPVTVVFSSNGFRICVDSTCPPTSSSFLRNPQTGQSWDGSGSGRGGAPSGVTITSSPTNSVTFNGLGRPSAALTISIDSRSITVEAETGYVR